MSIRLTVTAALLLIIGCAHTRTPMGEGCIDGTVRPADLYFIADGSGRHYTPLTADPGSPHLDLRPPPPPRAPPPGPPHHAPPPSAGHHLPIRGPTAPEFRLHTPRIPAPPPR